MKNIKRILLTFFISTMVFMTACNIVKKDDDKNIIKVEKYNINFTFPKDWEKVTKETPYDLQCTNNEAFASVFGYYKIDLTEEQTPLDIFNYQKDNIFSKRENVNTITEQTVNEYGDKKIYSQLYSAEKDGSKNYYYCNLIEFSEESGEFAWVVFTALPSYAEEHIDEWNSILTSADWVKEK